MSDFSTESRFSPHFLKYLGATLCSLIIPSQAKEITVPGGNQHMLPKIITKNNSFLKARLIRKRIISAYHP